MKYYFQKYDSACYTLDYHKDFMKFNNIKTLELFEAKRITDTDYFFCKEFQEIGEVNGTCGKMCDKYKPNNGKSGRCKSYGFTYEQTEKKIILTL